MKPFASQRACESLLIATLLNIGSSLGFSQTPTSTVAMPTAVESVPAPVHRTTKTFKEMLSTAQSFFDAGRYTIARNWFRLALDARPGNAKAALGFERADQAAVEAGDYSAQQEAEQSQLQQKLQTLIVPQVTFDHMRLADAIEFFRREGTRLDTDHAQSERGITIFVKYPAAAVSTLPTSGTVEGKAADTLPATPDTPVSITLYNLSLLHALSEVVRPLGMCVKVCFDGVYLTGISEVWPDKLVTREYHVAAQVICADEGKLAEWKRARAAGQTSVESVDEKVQLEASGVTFPDGASAVFLPVAQKLVVRNTRENLELIEYSYATLLE